MTQIVFSLTRERYLKDVVIECLILRVHSTYTPREITERAKDSEFIQKVKENTTKSRRIEKYKIGLKVLILNYRTLVEEDGFVYYTTPHL